MNLIIFLIISIILIILILTNNNYKEDFSILNPLPGCYKDMRQIFKNINKKRKVCMNYTNFNSVLKCFNPFYPIAY
uniref:Uncharacterized protein n=1 Tax=viral metagenome TaxID=1070528 RepID=A0A6C0IVL9_9ZZZZ